jgi:hypothetical protein
MTDTNYIAELLAELGLPEAPAAPAENQEPLIEIDPAACPECGRVHPAKDLPPEADDWTCSLYSSRLAPTFPVPFTNGKVLPE